jgi:Tfp pilus assembly protein PilN
MIRINLLPKQPIVFDRGRRREASLFLGVLVLFAGVLAYVSLRKSGEISRLRQEVVRAEMTVQGLEKLKQENSRVSGIKKDLSLRLKAIQGLEEKRVGPWKVLEELSTRAPDALWLTELNESDGKATLTGLALDPAAIASFLINLARSPRFTNVDLIEVVEEQKNGRPLKRFSAKADFKY